MIPIRHTLPPRTTPTVNRGLVIANGIVFLTQIFLGDRTESVINLFGFIPARLTNPAAYGYSMLEVCVTLVTSLFLHGGFVHLIGNMIYLWVFGGAVEDALGHVRYGIFFIVCGAIGSLTHTLLFPHSTVPSIGASGSIAGILGAFLVLRPKARIVTLLPLVVYWAMIELRAVIFLPIWFAMQFFNGFLSFAAAHRTQEVAGVAWWAHVGGFLFGALVGLIARRGKHERVTPYAAETEDV
ncbi:MAG: rhomboid family intramembrane serine protease [Acidobacteria bacterium]|nr:rhomboid family intramembrane serine protease [Acidobacteriota bacterium]MBV9071007.1 rhomboid family intramembrane serine protease [Acidobacteriota bacterium]MBV9184534.1 rhomboid family intramembrane serine protease [Acidobacteriota bacterium]